MSGLTPSLSPTLPAGTDVPLDECFPIDDAPARSPDCISFGPHNVLQVCSRWSIAFFLGNLLSPARQCQIRNHPLCHRTDLESVETVVGAKWSSSLLPEVFYPACARVCVQTTSNLVVYRVTRHGSARVEVSCGIGIACCRGGAKHVKGGDASSAGAKGAPATGLQPSTATISSPASAAEKDGATHEVASRKRKTSAKPAQAPPAKKKKAAPPPRKQRRRRKSSSEDDDESESDDSSSSSESSSSSSSSSSDDSDDSDSSCASDVKKSTRRASTSTRGGCSIGTVKSSARGSSQPGKRNGVAPAAPSAAPLRSTSGTSRSSPVLVEEEEDAASCRQADAALIDYLWLSNDDLVILTTHGLHILPFYGDFSDDESPLVRELPPPVYRWGSRDDTAGLGFKGPTPVCLAAVSAAALSALALVPESGLDYLQRTVVVASPYLLRALHVSSTTHAPGSPAAVQLLQSMEVPTLTAVPTAICAVAATLKSVSAAAPSAAMHTAEVVTFLAAPGLVLRGRFTLPLPSSVGSPASSSTRVATWSLDGQFGPEQLVGEVSLRGLTVAPFAAEMPAARSDAAPGSLPSVSVTASSSSSTTTTTATVSTAVLGVGDRSLVQYLLSGPSCATLFQCPLLVGRSAMPAQKCAAVAGVALHPAGGVAVMALQSGHVSRELLHLWAVTVDGNRSWLRRFVELAGVLREDPSDSDGARQDAPGQPHTSVVADGVGATTEHGVHNHHDGDTALSGYNSKALARSQVSDGYMLRERLLSGSTAQSSDLHHYTQVWQETYRVPSGDTLQQCRAAAQSRDGTAADGSITAAALPRSRTSRIPDLGLRHAFLQLRAKHGVALFLRWPLPTTGAAGGGTAASTFASAREMELRAATWPWWRLLRHIWASCPWDRPVLHELLLSNAVRILAKRFGYANMAFTPAERFRERREEGATTASTSADASRCATDPDTVDIDGARCYVEAYVAQQEALLNLAVVGSGDGTLRGSSDATLTAADCEPPTMPSSPSKSGGRGASAGSPKTQLHWCVSEGWVAALKAFLASVVGNTKGSAKTVVPSPPSTAAAKRSNAAAAAPPTAACSTVYFPCSLCDRDNVAVLGLSLSSTSQHVPLSSDTAGEAQMASPPSSLSTAAPAPAVTHTTLFSGTTFSPLSFFSPDYVLTRCVACGLSDYADGPLCRVCGGLLE